MFTLTVKLPEALAAKLEALVKKRGQKRSEVVREAIARAVDEQSGGEPSLYDLVKDLKGAAGKGPKDLASNPKHMRGYGR